MTSRRTPGRYSVTIIPRKIGAITLFVDDLQRARSFYLSVFGGPVMYQDENSAVFGFGDTVVNLLDARATGDLLELGTGRGIGSRFVLSIWVDDVDAIVTDLQRARSRSVQRSDRPRLGQADRKLHRPGWAYLGDRPGHPVTTRS